MTCSRCKGSTYFNSFEGETGQWCCHSCGEQYDEVIERNRRTSALLSIPPEMRHPDTNIHDARSMTALLGYSEKYFKQHAVRPSGFAPSSHFHMYIDSDGTWHTHTDSLHAGDMNGALKSSVASMRVSKISRHNTEPFGPSRVPAQRQGEQ